MPWWGWLIIGFLCLATVTSWAIIFVVAGKIMELIEGIARGR